MIPDKSQVKSEKIRWIAQLYQEKLTRLDRDGKNSPLPGRKRLGLLFLNSHQVTHIFHIQKQKKFLEKLKNYCEKEKTDNKSTCKS